MATDQRANGALIATETAKVLAARASSSSEWMCKARCQCGHRYDEHLGTVPASSDATPCIRCGCPKYQAAPATEPQCTGPFSDDRMCPVHSRYKHPATGAEQVHAPKTIVPEPDQRRIETERFPQKGGE